ncbi:hypothetical protein BAE44_0002792 [Dichanthelium oligosanthes]|uniref:NAC-A/B domain-containing protein n=1 Tax=Dichanthelium oligosanthes TaxID=888268 RepID=A0A1E5WGB2_9POAL|nr:hypothetical protein BAE44_0002792 [Dichanthelium oligosanthes]
MKPRDGTARKLEGPPRRRPETWRWVRGSLSAIDEGRRHLGAVTRTMQPTGGGATGRYNESRSDKMSKKAMQRLGMKTTKGVRRVTIKKKNSPISDTYVIFGDAKVTYLRPQPQSQAAGQFKAQAETCEDEEEVDESSIEPEDIELVMT